MDGISRMAAGGVCLNNRGAWINVRPLTLGDIGSCETKILVEDRSPIEDARDAFERLGIKCESLIRQAIEQCRKRKELRVAPARYFQEWLYSPSGIAYTLFLCVDEFPDPGHAAANATADLVRARDIASSLDDLSSLDWPESDAGIKGKFIPWRKIYRSFADRYNWSPETVNSLTLYQLRVYSAEVVGEGVGKSDSPEKGEDIMAVLRRQGKL